jgi:hypothetical protein
MDKCHVSNFHKLDVDADKINWKNEKLTIWARLFALIDFVKTKTGHQTASANRFKEQDSK